MAEKAKKNVINPKPNMAVVRTNRAPPKSNIPSVKKENVRPNNNVQLVNNKNNLVRINPEKAEKYRKEGEARIREQMLREREAKLNQKKAKRKEGKAKKKEEEGSWWNTIKEAGSAVLKYGLPLLLGAGDYDEESKVLTTQEMPKSNSLLAIASKGKQGTDVPMMHREGNKIRCTHREYLGDIYSTISEFETLEFPINPGMNESFPWLGPISNQFTGYNFLGVNSVFVSEGSEYTNSVGLGYTAMAFQYNTLDPTFDSKKDMLNSQFAVSAKPSKSYACWMECKPSDRVLDHLFVRSGDIPPDSDKRLYDASKLVVAVGGHTTPGVVIGELWITYDVELLLPKSSTAQNPNQVQWSGVSGDNTVSTTNPLGTGGFTNSQFYYNTFSLTWVSSTRLTWPKGYAGTYDLRFIWTHGTAVTAAFSLPTFTWPACFLTVNNIANPGVAMTSTGAACRTGTIVRITCSDKSGDIVLTPGPFVMYGSTCAVSVVVQQVATLSEFEKKSCTIFDPHGKNHTQRYQMMMEGFVNKRNKTREPKKDIRNDPDAYRITDNYVMWLIEGDDDEELFVSENNSTGLPKYPVPDTLTLKEIDSWNDEIFDNVCRAIIDKDLVERRKINSVMDHIDPFLKEALFNKEKIQEIQKRRSI